MTVSVQTAATHFGVSEQTIRRWAHEGRLTAERVGPRLLRVDLESLHPEPIAGSDDPQ